MAYVTEDKNIKPIIARLRNNEITEAEARAAIKTTTPSHGSDHAFLDWEVEEAIDAAKLRKGRK